MRTGAATAQLVGFKRHIRAEVSTGEGAYLFSERGVTVLKGEHVEAITTLLDGTRDLATLLGAVPTGTAPEQAAGLIARLVDAGLVTLRAPVLGAADERTVAYWEASGVDAAVAVAATGYKTVRLLTVGDIDPDAMSAGLRSAGLTLTTDAEQAVNATMSVVLCDDYLNPDLAEIDASHRADQRPWLLAKPLGAKVWIGPFFQPPAAGCWHCLAVRLWGHRSVEACAQIALGRRGPALSPAASVPPLASAAVQLVALEATKWLAGYRYPDQRSVWTFDSLDLRGEHHEVRDYPQCAACGNPELMREQGRRPVVLASRRKESYGGGGHRSSSPEEVRGRYWHLVSPVTGIIKEIRRDKRGPAFFNSFRSGGNVAAKTNNLNAVRAALRAENGGKGTTAVHAEVSALCEAIERHSGTFRGDEECVRGSLRSLGKRAIHPNTCQLYHERQYLSRDAWNAAHAKFQFVCERFDEHAVIDWTPVWSLSERRHRLLPTRFLFYNAPAGTAPRCVVPDSNGNAAGSSLEDAVLQGLLELVERDAVALWWYNRTMAPAVDLDAFGDPWTEELREVYQRLGREVWALDLTSDLHIPVMVAVSRRVDRPPEEIMFGFGAHLDPRVALRRALTELNQLMPAVVEPAPDGQYGYDDPTVVNWWRHATVANQPYLLPDPEQRPSRPADYGYLPRQDLLEDITAIQARVEELGMELLVLNQTRPDIGLPVAKVIVPGMRHFWARFAPGRLFDVPVRLGRLTRPTSYEELNPIPMFL
jgi:ribosomal protein S12 methylthiotransferase accessory factor